MLEDTINQVNSGVILSGFMLNGFLKMGKVKTLPYKVPKYQEIPFLGNFRLLPGYNLLAYSH